jgi:hypothetical protein
MLQYGGLVDAAGTSCVSLLDTRTILDAVEKTRHQCQLVRYPEILDRVSSHVSHERKERRS